MSYRFSLDKSPRKFICPRCNQRRLVRYVDNRTKLYLPEFVGRCDRENNCKYDLRPKQYFERNPNHDGFKLRENTFEQPIKKSIDFIDDTYCQSAMKEYHRNNFVLWLHTLFGKSKVKELVELYKIGTSKKWKGATVFFQLDINQRIRQGKVMLYHAKNGRRVKNEEFPFKGKSKIFFIGKFLLKKHGIKAPNLKQCFFGEHLLKGNKKIVGIVESEKTAILLQAYSMLGFAPDYVWLATGGKNGCRWYKESSIVLLNRNVILFPDLGAYDIWKSKSKFITNCNLVVSDILENIASPEDKRDGLDIADFFLREEEYGKENRSISSASKISKADQEKLDLMKNANPMILKMVERFHLCSSFQ